MYAEPIGMSDTIARIEKLENGYTVQVQDPKIAEKNRTSKTGWEDPYKAFSFNTSKDVCEFLEKVLDKLAPPSASDEFTSAFKAATKKDD